MSLIHMNSLVADKLSSHNLRKTDIRKRVLNIFFDSKGLALSNRDIEEKLSEHDRITLYRTLKSFEQHGLIHKAIDGTGIPKYALCSEHCTEHSHRDVHAHFYCLTCEKTTCLDDTMVAQPKLSTGFQIQSAQLVLKGICQNCSKPKD